MIDHHSHFAPSRVWSLLDLYPRLLAPQFCLLWPFILVSISLFIGSKLPAPVQCWIVRPIWLYDGLDEEVQYLRELRFRDNVGASIGVFVFTMRSIWKVVSNAGTLYGMATLVLPFINTCCITWLVHSPWEPGTIPSEMNKSSALSWNYWFLAIPSCS